MEFKEKPERQYAGKVFDVEDATPDDKTMDKYNSDDKNVDLDTLSHDQSIMFYDTKIKSFDITLDCVKLSSKADLNDIIKVWSLIINFIISKKEEK